MSNIVLLDNVEHHDLKVRPTRGGAFGDHVNQCLVFPNEFHALQREYPIFFRKDDQGAFQAVVLLGLDRDENLYLKDGMWQARYIPAIQARGPFSIGLKRPTAAGEEPEPLIQVDLDNPAVNRTDGHPVFLPQGGHAPYLEYTIDILKRLHDGVGASKAFFAAIEEYDLMEPVSMEIKLSDTMQYSVPGIYSIGQEKFQNLPDAALGALHRSGHLAVCHWVLASLENVNRLVEMKRQAESGQ